jgi:hypothetical protein
MTFLGPLFAARGVVCILAVALVASSSHAQQIFLEQIDVLTDAAPDGWTIEDGRVTQKDASGSTIAFTWTKPPLEIDEEGFSLTMTIVASANVKTRMEVSGSFIADPPQARSIETNAGTRGPDPSRSSIKITPPGSCRNENICELRIASHAGYGAFIGIAPHVSWAGWGFDAGNAVAPSPRNRRLRVL